VKAWVCGKELGAEDAIKVYTLAKNSGKGAAVRAGMLQAEGDLLLMMDADGATDLAHGLEALEFALCTRHIKNTSPSGNSSSSSSRMKNSNPILSGEKNRSSVVEQRKGQAKTSGSIIEQAGGYRELSSQRLAAFGSRAHLEQEDIVTQRTKLRNFAMHGFHLLVFLVVGGSIRDTQCGFKLFTREAAFSVFQYQRLKRWCFDVELINIAQRLKVPIVEVQVKWQEMEGSKLKFLHVFHMTLELLTIFVCYNLRMWRIKTGKAL
jgi:dolichyl-phosphate beta-glucosyltransferase